MNRFNSRNGACGGFTLIELLIVIGIIGILAAVTLSQFTGATESAKAAKCMTNLRALAVAAHNYAMSEKDGYMPSAGSYEYMNVNGLAEHVGWISWVHEKGIYDSTGTGRRKKYVTTHKSSPSWTTYATYPEGNKSERDRALFALSNGVVWAHCGRSSAAYVCPKHLEACRNQKKKVVPAWSYVMNSYFGFDQKQGSATSPWNRVQETNMRSRGGASTVLGADKVLLFAELPFQKIEPKFGSVQNSVELYGNTPAFDCVLQYDMKPKLWSGTAESIGFNHRSGRSYYAHVAFADGHVASLALPRDANATDVRELTAWLCQGDDVVFMGKRYERTNKADEGTN